ncbi:MAG: HIT family protein [Bacteroidales bacterium]|jgi:histidine triad (HIT) family protein|nr:HIT family protein [Bacteroidales bacterium]
MASIFSRIVAREIPSYKVAESNKFFAFLDINPLAKGHTLVIPKKEVDYIFDLDDELYKELFAFAKKVGIAIESVVPCKRMGIIVFGLDVPHAHIHLIPINKASDMNFESPKLSFEKETFLEIAAKINKAFENGA